MIDGMETKDWITIAAIIIGPILAVQAQKMVEAIRSKKQKTSYFFSYINVNTSYPCIK